MSSTRQPSQAIVVMPAIGGGRLRDASLGRWLARSELRRHDAPRELLSRVLEALDEPYPASGLGALRMWGQAGERPTAWMAAADPVYLEPRLDHLCLHAQPARDVPPADLRPLFDHLQATLADATTFGFARVGRCGYLTARVPIPAADVPPCVVHLDMPNAYMPSGAGADRYRGLVSEIEMALHDHDINLRRQQQGLQPINSLWLWGAGFAPEPSAVPLPPLFAFEPLLRGYWLSKGAAVADWPGNIPDCVDGEAAGFVAEIPQHDEPRLLATCLRELRGLLRRREVDRLALIFRDGIEATIEPGHRWRFWRRQPEFLA